MFRRRRPQTPPVDLFGNATAIRAVTGVPADFEPAALYTTGWRAFGHGQAASEQIGAYAGTPLTSYPGAIAGPQLNNGVQGLSSAWCTPGTTWVPNELRTNQAAQLAGGIRDGSRFSGLVGPLSVRRMRARVAQAAISQTALMAQPWAGILQPSDEPIGGQ